MSLAGSRNMSQVLIHIGVHKTGTTYIQSNLSAQREKLAEQGVVYIPQAELRSLVVQKLGWGWFVRRGIRRELLPYLDHRRLILSDENIIGATLPVRGGVLYPYLEKRLRRLLRAIPSDEVDIVMSIRDYPGYFVSMYCEYLRYHPYISFETYTAQLDFDRISWVDVVERVARLAAPGRLHLVDFSGFAADKEKILDYIAGVHVESQAFAGAEIVRRTFSRSLWQELLLSVAQKGADSAPRIVHELEASGRFLDGERYMPMDFERRQVVIQRYREEVAQLRTRYPFIN